MKTRLLLFLPALTLLAGCAGGVSSFHEIDLDGDGRASRGEFSDAVAQITFAKADRNGDGFIELAEWRAVEGAGADPLFRARDLSRNGRISWPEARLAAEKNGSLTALFSRIDRNRDGSIDRDEAKQYQATLR